MSSGRVNATQRDAIAVLELDNPPVNALAQPVRAALLQSIIAAEADPAIAAIVIHGAGRHFVAGADIREFDHEPLAPLLNEVLLRIESSVKPVIGAIHGSAFGGGLELALACHYRIARPDSLFGMPEIRLGLIPGSGGTQRLPRLIGVEQSLRLMLSGDPIDCARAAALGIVDQSGAGPDLLESALEFAKALVAAQRGPRRLREQPVCGLAPEATVLDVLRATAARKFPGVRSVDAIIECVEASVTTEFMAGLALSRRRFEECRISGASRALRHLFFAERGASGGPRARSIHRIGVLGAGTMGSGIAVGLATAGYEVVLVDTTTAAMTAGFERVRSTITASVEKGRLSAAAGAVAIARVQAMDTIDSFKDVDFVIEAVFESLAVKTSVFATLGKICRPGAVLASNTSTLDIDAIAAASNRAADVIGMHFFSPANIMRLVEIVRGAKTASDVIATTTELSRRMGKLGVVVGNCFGFVGNRMLYAYGRENQLLMLEGATPAQIDDVMQKFGMAMGPNAVGDLAGLDVGYRVRRERKDLPADPRYYRVADLLVESGRLGQKSGQGAFTYAMGSRTPLRDAAVEEMIAAESSHLQIERRAIKDAEIRDRCLFALINEGASILGEGIASSPADIDAIWCNGYGFPRYRGGPMFYADTLGPAAVLHGIQQFAKIQGAAYWTPAPLLEQIAACKATFQTWQAHRVS